MLFKKSNFNRAKGQENFFNMQKKPFAGTNGVNMT